MPIYQNNNSFSGFSSESDVNVNSNNRILTNNAGNTSNVNNSINLNNQPSENVVDEVDLSSYGADASTPSNNGIYTGNATVADNNTKNMLIKKLFKSYGYNNLHTNTQNTQKIEITDEMKQEGLSEEEYKVYIEQEKEKMESWVEALEAKKQILEQSYVSVDTSNSNVDLDALNEVTDENKDISEQIKSIDNLIKTINDSIDTLYIDNLELTKNYKEALAVSYSKVVITDNDVASDDGKNNVKTASFEGKGVSNSVILNYTIYAQNHPNDNISILDYYEMAKDYANQNNCSTEIFLPIDEKTAELMLSMRNNENYSNFVDKFNYLYSTDKEMALEFLKKHKDLLNQYEGYLAAMEDISKLHTDAEGNLLYLENGTEELDNLFLTYVTGGEHALDSSVNGITKFFDEDGNLTATDYRLLIYATYLAQHGNPPTEFFYQFGKVSGDVAIQLLLKKVSFSTNIGGELFSITAQDIIENLNTFGDIGSDLSSQGYSSDQILAYSLLQQLTSISTDKLFDSFIGADAFEDGVSNVIKKESSKYFDVILNSFTKLAKDDFQDLIESGILDSVILGKDVDINLDNYSFDLQKVIIGIIMATGEYAGKIIKTVDGEVIEISKEDLIANGIDYVAGDKVKDVETDGSAMTQGGKSANEEYTVVSSALNSLSNMDESTKTRISSLLDDLSTTDSVKAKDDALLILYAEENGYSFSLTSGDSKYDSTNHTIYINDSGNEEDIINYIKSILDNNNPGYEDIIKKQNEKYYPNGQEVV